MAGYTHLIVERQGPIATVRLNRPEKHNALNAALSFELIHCLDALEADDSVRVIVLTGSGDKAFCAGADMAEAVADTQNGGYVGAPAQATVRLLRVRKPVIAAVNGYAYGGGAVLAINCDIRIASDSARFRFVGASYGLVVGASQLPRIVGAPLAKELIFTARTIDAAEALRIGLANHVVPLEGLETTVLDMARAIAENSPTAVRASKEVIDIVTANKDAARRELAHNTELRQSQEHRDRFRAAAERVTGK
ncbi:MAG TPA: enoyl-CoA hydratase/isomerase family protein [Dehalococcoidia bacterium]|nr:enoyl-CoA hydratase/isomerase family protein [Dehalococcoidia bacterium]